MLHTREPRCNSLEVKNAHAKQQKLQHGTLYRNKKLEFPENASHQPWKHGTASTKLTIITGYNSSFPNALKERMNW